MTVRDPQIRAPLIERLRGTLAPGSVIIPEFGLQHAVVADLLTAEPAGLLELYEIKSEVDSLRRLKMQAQIYSYVADKATLVCGWNHYGAARKLVPEWWGIDTVGFLGEITQARAAGLNPDVIPLQVANLLWRTEMLAALRANGSAKGLSGLHKGGLAQLLIERLDPTALRAAARAAIIARQWDTNRQAPIRVEARAA